jgi:hypothetical protein
MRQAITLFVLSGIFCVALTGCQTRQAKVDARQKEYDRLGAQFQKDCSAEYFKVPPTLSQKCAAEKKRTDEAYKRLQDERAKQ